MNKQPLTDNNGEVRELTSADFKRMRPIAEFPELQFLVKHSLKRQFTIKLNSEIVDFFKSHGQDWQSEVNNVLQNYINTVRQV